MCRNDLQDLMQKMMADVFTDQPEDPLTYMMTWMETEKRRRDLAAEEASSGA